MSTESRETHNTLPIPREEASVTKVNTSVQEGIHKHKTLDSETRNWWKESSIQEDQEIILGMPMTVDGVTQKNDEQTEEQNVYNIQ